MTREELVGVKRSTRIQKRRNLRILETALLVILVLTFCYAGYYFLTRTDKYETENFTSHRAALVDQVGAKFPNETFVRTTTQALEDSGFEVDYYSSDNVTVSFYRNMPSLNYGLIILRVHSSATNPDNTQGPVTIFTSERYDKNKHVQEQSADRLAIVSFSQADLEKGISYFGINPSFVEKSMNGRFRNTTVVMMGCEGLSNTLMAQAFIARGAQVYIGWDRAVTVDYADSATTRLLELCLTTNQTLRENVREIFIQIGWDPSFQTLLLFYPLEAGSINTFV